MNTTPVAPTPPTPPVPPAGPVLGTRLDRGPSAWLRDLRLGVRLAIGGGRTSLLRLVFTTVGIGLAATVLLLGACVPTLIDHYQERVAAGTAVTTPITGISPLYSLVYTDEYQGTTIAGTYVYAAGSNAPVPPGLGRVPGPNEIVLSPALAGLLDSPAGAILRKRFPERGVGTIGEAGLTQPTDLSYYAGASADLVNADGVQRVYGYGNGGGDGIDVFNQDALFGFLLANGLVVLLLPILVFVSVSSRIAGAQRDRRLAALRLAGAGAKQTRRIAAAESLVGAATGLVLGVLLFLLARQALGGVSILNFSAFTSDLVPSWPFAVLAVLIVPVISVGTALVALRRTLIEPLGVFRESRPVRRRSGWRLALIASGVAALSLLPLDHSDTLLRGAQSVFGVTALLVGVPAILPWLLERTAGMLRGGSVSWQLAVRRLQLDSGTPARVFAGVAVVLAGAIVLQTMLVAVEASTRLSSPGNAGDLLTGNDGRQVGIVEVTGDGDLAGQVAATLRGTSGVFGVDQFWQLPVRLARPVQETSTDDGQTSTMPTSTAEFDVAGCAEVQRLLKVSDCRDGDVFAPIADPSWGTMIAPPAAGSTVTVTDETGLEGDVPNPKNYGAWTVPATVRSAAQTPLAEKFDLGPVLLTPGALGKAVSLNNATAIYAAQVDPYNQDSPDDISDALAPYLWRTQAFPLYTQPISRPADQLLGEARSMLMIGSLFTLAVAGASLLVLALEQMRERGRSLAALTAAGVPRGVLARSLLWQTAIPVVVATVVANAAGIAMAALVLRWTNLPITFDWSEIALFDVVAIAMVLMVTVLTLPALRSVTRLTTLRTA